MKHILLLCIRIYWLTPLFFRRKCLFACSCSRYVYLRTNEGGYSAGLAAFRERRKQCKPGYSVYQTPDGMNWVILADKKVVPKDDTIL